MCPGEGSSAGRHALDAGDDISRCIQGLDGNLDVAEEHAGIVATNSVCGAEGDTVALHHIGEGNLVSLPGTRSVEGDALLVGCEIKGVVLVSSVNSFRSSVWTATMALVVQKEALDSLKYGLAVTSTSTVAAIPSGMLSRAGVTM